MARRDSRAFRPGLVGLEARCVPTVISPLAFGGRGLAAQQRLDASMSRLLSGRVTPATTSSGGGGSGNTTATNGNTGTTSDNNNGSNVGNPSPSVYLDPATLTQRGLARDRFTAQTFGPFAVTQPLYVGPVREVTYIGSVVSSQFAQGTLIIRLDTPTAPHVVPLNGFGLPFDPSLVTNGQAVTIKNTPIDGFASLRDRNVASTGNALVIDTVVTAMDQYGRPTRFAWTVDDNSSAGVYSGSAGEGTASIVYFAKGRSRLAAGSAGIVFSGLINPNGISDITQFVTPNFA